MKDHVPGTVRWLLAAAAVLVPAHRRAAWRRQWEAEIAHRRASPDGSSG